MAAAASLRDAPRLYDRHPPFGVDLHSGCRSCPQPHASRRLATASRGLARGGFAAHSRRPPGCSLRSQPFCGMRGVPNARRCGGGCGCRAASLAAPLASSLARCLGPSGASPRPSSRSGISPAMPLRRPNAASRLAASGQPSGAWGLPFAACGLPFGRPWLSAGAPSSRSSAGSLRAPLRLPLCPPSRRPLAALRRRRGFAASVAFGSLAAPPPWGGARQRPPVGGPFSRRARPTLGGLRWCRNGGRHTCSPAYSPADRGRWQAVARERLTRGHCRCIIQMLFSVPHSSCIAHCTSPRTGDKE